jgi:hypothetical protein
MIHKNRQSKEIHVFEVPNVFLRAEGFSCIFDVHHGGLGIRAIFNQKRVFSAA